MEFNSESILKSTIRDTRAVACVRKYLLCIFTPLLCSVFDSKSWQCGRISILSCFPPHPFVYIRLLWFSFLISATHWGGPVQKQQSALQTYIHRHLIARVSPLLRYVDVAAILKRAVLPRELIQINGVNFIKLLLQSAISQCLSFTLSHMYRYIQETEKNQKHL